MEGFFQNKAWLFTLVIYTMCFALAGCYKDNSENFADEESIIENAAIGQQEADEALDIAYQAEWIQKQSPGGTTVLSCDLISDDNANKILTITFSSGTLCGDFFGRTRNGKIIVGYSGSLGDTLADRTVTFDSYRVNNRKVEGTISLHDVTVVSDTILQATRTLTDLKVTFPNGASVTFNGDQTRSWTSGRGDTIINNNVYTFLGSLSGISSSGRSFTQDITVPVVTNFSCAFEGDFARTAGVVELSTLDGYPDRKRSVDYGDSTCNKIITVTTFRRTYATSTD
jgi:hypothetical protein